MQSALQFDVESCRVIVFGQNRTEILLVWRETGFQLPSVEVPRWQRLAENLTSAVKRQWNCEAVCLFASRGRSGSNCVATSYQIMECLDRPARNASNAVWARISSLSEDSFTEAADHAALQQCLAECSSYAEDVGSPFAKPGWFRELQNWVSDVIHPLGLELNGPVSQFNASPSFSLFRFETSGPAIWFKAVGEPKKREFPIVLKLAQLFPGFLPRIIAIQPDWNGWLSFEAEGTNLGETRETSQWNLAAAMLAKLQVESVNKLNDITPLGARDLMIVTLSALVQPFFEVMAHLMRRQTKASPPILGKDELYHLQEQVLACLAELQDLGIPDALGHLDLNPGNIIVSPDGCAFLDWAEACIGNPFFSYQYLLEHFRRTVRAESSAEASLTIAYVEQWEGAVSPPATDKALRLAPLLAAFAYATGNDAWKDSEKLSDPTTAGYLRSLTRRMNSEAKQLIDRRSPCLC